MVTEKLAKIFTQHEGRRVLVIGDVILDAYIEGSKAKTSPEAPVIAVHGRIKRWRAQGGAGNVAESVRRLGGKVALMSLTGYHEPIEKAKSDIIYNVFRHRTPPIKTRIVCGGHHICRVDEEEICHLSGADLRRVLKVLDIALEEFNPNSIILADYGKSGITGDSFNKIKQHIESYCFETKRRILLVVDSKTPYRIDQTRHGELNLDILFTPNLEEWAAYVPRHGKTCRTLVTLGSGGLEYLDLGDDARAKLIRPFSLPTVLDVCGAGDTVTATCALVMEPFETSEDREANLELAQLVAESSVQKFGVNPPFLAEVLDYAKDALRKA